MLCNFWLLPCDIIKFLIKAKEMGGREEPVFVEDQWSYSNQERVRQLQFYFDDEKKGCEFYEWGVNNHSRW